MPHRHCRQSLLLIAVIWLPLMTELREVSMYCTKCVVWKEQERRWILRKSLARSGARMPERGAPLLAMLAVLGLFRILGAKGSRRVSQNDVTDRLAPSVGAKMSPSPSPLTSWLHHPEPECRQAFFTPFTNLQVRPLVSADGIQISHHMLTQQASRSSIEHA